MTSPTSPWVDGEQLTAAKMYARTTALIQALPGGYVNTVTSSNAVTFANTSQFVADAVQTVTGGRRYRVLVKSTFTTSSGAPARYIIQPFYSTTTSLSAANGTAFGTAMAVVNSGSGNGGSQSQMAPGSIFVPAGSTYTLGIGVIRNSGGSTNDTASSFYLLVEDTGAA